MLEEMRIIVVSVNFDKARKDRKEVRCDERSKME